MFFILFLIFLINIIHTFDCDSVNDYSGYEYSNAMECINQQEYSESVQSSTLATVQSVYGKYVYRDINVNSGSPYYINVDVQSELDEIAAKSFHNDYMMHVEIQKTINKLRDAHTKYVPPFCYAAWGFVMPFKMEMKLVGGWEPKFYIKPASSFVRMLYGNVYPDLDDLTYRYEDWEIKKINGEDPYNVIYNYAVNTDSYSRDLGARFNDALSTYFDFSAMMYEAPKEESIEFEIYSISAGSKTITAKWMAHSAIDFSQYTSFKAVCGYGSRRNAEEEEINLFDKYFPKAEIKPSYFNLNGKITVFNESKNLVMLEQKMKKEKDKKIQKEKERRKVELDYYDTIVEGSDISCYVDMYTTHGVLVVEGFSPESPINFVKDVKKCLTSLKKKSIEKLIVDLRGNGGGYVCLYIYLAQMLSSYVPIAFNPVGDLIGDDYWKKYYCSNYNPQSLQLLGENRKPETSSSWLSGEEYTRGGKTSTYSVGVGLDCSLFKYSIFEINEIELETIIPFEPENLILLTEGKCGSACGMFVSLFKQLKLARIVTQGGVLEEGEKLALSSFKGASVLNTQNLMDETSTLYSSCNLKNAIPRFPGQQLMTFSWYEIYPYDQVTINEMGETVKTTPIGYVKFESDDHLRNWNFDNEDSEVYTLTSAFFEGCYSWEVKKSNDCSGSVSNGVYGYPCKNGTWDESSCALRGCEAGYYLTYDGQCISNAEEYDMYQYYIQYLLMIFINNYVLPVGIIGILLLCCCCIVCIGACIGIIICCCCCCKKKKKEEFATASYVKLDQQNVVQGRVVPNMPTQTQFIQPQQGQANNPQMAQDRIEVK